MKKFFAVIMLFLMIGTMLFGCKPESLTDTMRKSLDMDEVLTELGRLEEEGSLLLFGATAQDACYAAEFSKNEKGDYIFKEEISLTKCNGNNYMCKWEDGYAFVCNDERAVSFKAAITPTGAEPVITDVQIEHCPWVYYLKLPEDITTYSGSYFFLDTQGGIVS